MTKLVPADHNPICPVEEIPRARQWNSSPALRSLANVNEVPLNELVSIHDEKVNRELVLKLLSPSN